MTCADGKVAALVVNGKAACDVPRIVEKVPGGERTLVGLRALGDAFGGGVTFDWYTEIEDRAVPTTYVWGANRHYKFRLQKNSPVLERWQVTANGDGERLPDLTMDTSVKIINGTTFLPVRFATEAVGGSIVSWTGGQIRISYADNLRDQDYQLAERMVPGIRKAHQAGLVTPDDVYFLADYQHYREMALAQGDPQWAAHNPFNYTRFTVLSEKTRLGRELTQKEYASPSVAGQIAAILGKAISWQTIQEVGRMGEEAMDLLADEYGWNEVGLDPYTGRLMDFRSYNNEHRCRDSLNGPDRVFTMTNSNLVIIHYIPVECKAILRPWIAISRFRENAPLYRQVEQLTKWNDPERPWRSKG